MGHVDLEERVARLEAELSLLKYQNRLKNDSLLARMARRWTRMEFREVKSNFLPLMQYDSTVGATYPKGRIMLVTSDGVSRDFIHLDQSDAIIVGNDFAAISKYLYFFTGVEILMGNPVFKLAASGSSQTPVWTQTVQSDNTMQIAYEQDGSPSQASHKVFELQGGADPQYFYLFNNSAAKGIGLKTGTGGNRGVLKIYDATAGAYKYAYIDNGAWVIAASEPT